jgi:hypothetical protein
VDSRGRGRKDLSSCYGGGWSVVRTQVERVVYDCGCLCSRACVCECVKYLYESVCLLCGVCASEHVSWLEAIAGVVRPEDSRMCFQTPVFVLASKRCASHDNRVRHFTPAVLCSTFCSLSD